MENPSYLRELDDFRGMRIPRPSVDHRRREPDNVSNVNTIELSDTVPPSYKTGEYKPPAYQETYPNKSKGCCCCGSTGAVMTLIIIIIVLVFSILLMLGLATMYIKIKNNDEVSTTIIPETTTTEDTNSPLVGWSEWNSWGTCSATCGGGSRSRARECEGQYNRCPGPGTQQEKCGGMRCPRPAFGQWSTWSGWSECSLPCGTGMQNRTRSCDITGDEEDCVGEESQSRYCNTWECPTCDRICPDLSKPSPPCTKCHCAHRVTGNVTNAFNLPLKDVIISDSYWPGIELTKSDRKGEFSIKNSCRGIKLLFEKAGQVSTTAIVTLYTGKIKMQNVVSLSISKQPEHKQRLAGESVTLCCTVSGSPPPDYIEWEKDGVYVDTVSTADNGSLVLTDLTLGDDGYYRCRASNDYSSIYSDEAHLIVKNYTDQFCLENPASRNLSLPAGCMYRSRNEIDVGLCLPLPCRGSRTNNMACTEESKHCCGAKVKELVNVQCKGFRMPVFITKSCGCGECFEPVIKIRGNAQSKQNKRPLRYGEIYVNGTLVDRTSSNGDFYIEIPKGDKRVAITAKDTNFNEFVTTTKVKELRSSTQGMYFVIIDMIPVGEDYMLNSDTDTEIDMGGKNPFAKIIIPPNSMYTLSGDKFDGEVQATLNIIDPRNTENALKTPGELSFIDENGKSQLLQTFGMFNIKFRSNETDEELQILDPVKVSLSKNLITGNNLPKLWKLNPAIGTWEDEGNLVTSNNTAYFGKFMESTTNEDEIIGNVTISVDYWTNFDAYSDEVCHSKIRIFESNQFNQLFQVKTNVEISILAMTDTEGTQPTASGSKLQSWSDDDGNENGYCMIHLCHTGQQDTKYNGYIIAEYTNEEFMSNEPFQLQPAPADETSGINSDTRDKIKYNTVGVNTTHPAISVSFDLTESGDEGPFYALDSPPSCSKNWACSEECSGAQFDDNHFRFYFQNVLNDSCKYEYTVQEHIITPGEEPLEPEYINYLAWFPALNDQYDICYIKVNIENGEDEVFRGFSKVGNTTYKYDDDAIKPGETMYGYRDRCPDSNNASVCLEIKHSGIVHNISRGSVLLDHTIMHIQHDPAGNSSLTCKRSEINQNLEAIYGDRFIHSDDSSFESYLEYKPYGRSFGIYCAQKKSSPQEARSMALTKCMLGRDAEYMSMPSETSFGDWAVKFTCTL